MDEKPSPKFKFAGRNITETDQKLLEECISQKRWQRSIPLSICGGAYILLAASRGHMASLQRLGSRPKMATGSVAILGSIVGFGFGELLGVDIVAERFVTEKPNSVVTMTIKQMKSQGKGFILTNDELIKDIQCSKQGIWLKSLPVLFGMAFSVGIHPSKLTASSKFGISSIMALSYLGAVAISRTVRMETFLRELPDSNTAKAYRKPYGSGITDEEILTFSACLYEAILYKALPASLLMGSAVAFAMKKGRIKMNKKYGIWPKTLIVGSLGFVLGFISNSYSCAQKFLTELPDSKTAKKFRKRPDT